MPARSLPMHHMSPWIYDEAQARDDLDDFAALLEPRTPLLESLDILPFFRAHADLCALMNVYNPRAMVYDRVGGEVSFFGQYRADLIVGDAERRAYTFIEFEDATEASIFARTNNQQHPWSARCEHAMSQIVDWLWITDAHPGSPLLRQTFGPQPMEIATVLVLGRDHWLIEPNDTTKRERLEWRRNKTIINSQKVYKCTFDELFNDLCGRAGYRPALATIPPPPARTARPWRTLRRRRP